MTTLRSRRTLLPSTRLLYPPASPVVSVLTRVTLLAVLLVASGCGPAHGGHHQGLDGDGDSDVGVTNACDTKVCAPDQRCELVATPCAPESDSCEPVAVCMDLDPLACTLDDCGPQPPTQPCADESPSQACERDALGVCGWQQLMCPRVGDPCTGCEPCPIPEFGECQWTAVGVCSQVSLSCV